MERALAWLGIFVASFGAAWFRLFAITKLWSWIAVPLFGAQPIGLWQAFGLSCLVALMTIHHQKITKDKDSLLQSLESVINSYLSTAFSLVLSYLLFA